MGAAAFIMAELLGVPYSQVALTAAVPAILYYLGIFVQVDLRSAKEGFRGVDKSKIPPLRDTLKKGWPFVVSVGLLLWAMFGWYLRAELAAMCALAGLLILAPLQKSTREGLKGFFNIVESVTRRMMELAVICGGAGLMVGVVSYTGLGQSLSTILTTLGGGKLIVLAILTTIASTILGIGLPITACYLFLAVTVAPAMVSIGVPPLLAHLFVFYYGTYSDLTPPVCLAVYTAASIAGAPMHKAANQAMKLAAAGYLVPFIFIYKPEMVFMGAPLDVALAIMDALIAVVLLAIAAEGYFRRHLSVVERCICLAASIAFFVPGWTSRFVGLALLGFLVLRIFSSAPKTLSTTAVQ
jgi:TRAP transporter 4TM/12TM fusion protein